MGVGFSAPIETSQLMYVVMWISRLGESVAACNLNTQSPKTLPHLNPRP